MADIKFATVNGDILSRWHYAAELDGIPTEAYRPRIKIVCDELGESEYTFGVILNEHRFNRPVNLSESKVAKCNLCNAVRLAQEEPKREFHKDLRLSDYVITSNKFAFMEGFSMAIAREERPVYTTKNLEGISRELGVFLDFADETGFEIFHNSPGFGASLPQHEHWHLTTFRGGYDIAGGLYGFDAAEKINSRESSEVKVMPAFPFAHLIFSRNDPERIVSFLDKIQKEIGNNYKEGSVPHVISQGFDGIFVTVGKKHLPKCRGSADMVGHLVVKSEKDFVNMDYASCIYELDNVAFKKEDLNLGRFL
ncbi:hypothetical protein K8R47_00470 [archaeon]|nr:hypothetical protein [archaeon]